MVPQVVTVGSVHSNWALGRSRISEIWTVYTTQKPNLDGTVSVGEGE